VTATVAAAVAFILTACSSSEPDNSGAQAPTAPASSAPPPVRTVVPPQPYNLPDDLGDLSPVCYGRGEEFRTRTAYEGEGPHPVVLPNRDLQELAEETLPSDWLPDDKFDVVLVACLTGSQERTLLGTCSYESALSGAIEGGGGTVSIDLYSLEYTFEVFALQTRELVAEIAAEATDGGCPESAFYEPDDPQERVYTELTGPELEAALEDVVTGRPR
jgi:hypothetical protein